MKQGTGIDLWWQDHSGFAYLSEARYVKDGKWRGFEWWLNDDRKSVMSESHFWNDRMRGIQRSWNRATGGLRRGYPKYWIHNQRVTKRQYVRACAKDPTLPPFREKDSHPPRRFPSEVAVHCIQRAL